MACLVVRVPNRNKDEFPQLRWIFEERYFKIK
jgi:hypothetical protein